MSSANLIRSELRKLTTTKMPWAFLAVLFAFAGLNAALVVAGTDFDGSKGFISTAADQQSLIAFSSNSLMLAALFGAIAVAREYGHSTVVPTFLISPHRHRAVLAQLCAVAFGGGLLGLVGTGLTVVGVAVALPTTDYGFLVSTGGVIRVLAASTLAGAAGATLGAGIAAIVRNTGGAVTGTFLALIIAPPMIVQITNSTANWVPSALANNLSGITDDLTPPVAIAAIVVWALVPAALGLVAVQRRDVV